MLAPQLPWMNGLNGLLGKVGKEQNTETLGDSKNRVHSVEEGFSCFHLTFPEIYSSVSDTFIYTL